MQLRGDPWRLRVRRGSPREGPRVERRAKERGPEAEPSEDRGLVIAVRIGCNAAVLRFVARMVCISRTVLHLNRSTRLTEASVEDVVQEVFRRVWANLDGYRGDGPLESWVFGFVQRTMREFARDEMRWRETQRTSLVDEDAPWLGHALAREDDSANDRIHLRETFESLPAELRTLVEGRVLEGASFEELARRLGSSESVVKRRYYRALAALRSAESEVSP